MQTFEAMLASTLARFPKLARFPELASFPKKYAQPYTLARVGSQRSMVRSRSVRTRMKLSLPFANSSILRGMVEREFLRFKYDKDVHSTRVCASGMPVAAEIFRGRACTSRNALTWPPPRASQRYTRSVKVDASGTAM